VALGFFQELRQAGPPDRPVEIYHARCRQEIADSSAERVDAEISLLEPI